jgi:flavin reductase (DIM6/NTAB) family NADH-FMN oxidoreductase RutF
VECEPEFAQPSRLCRRSEGYTVSVLAGDQGSLVAKFARGSLEERFRDVAVERLSSGRLKLSGSVAWFDCAIEKVVEAGDHDVLIGRILSFSSNNSTPLGYVRGHVVDLSS